MYPKNETSALCRCVGRSLCVSRYWSVAVSVGWSVGFCGSVTVGRPLWGRSLCRSAGRLIGRSLWVGSCGSVAMSVGWSVGRSLWVGRCEPVAVDWSLYTRRMRVTHFGSLLRSYDPPGLRSWRSPWVRRARQTRRSEYHPILYHNDSSAPAYLAQNSTAFCHPLSVAILPI